MPPETTDFQSRLRSGAYPSAAGFLGLTLFIAVSLVAQEPEFQRALPTECVTTSAPELLETIPRSAGFWNEFLQTKITDSPVTTDDWESFYSKEWGFTLRYPTSWRIEVQDTATGGMWLIFLKRHEESPYRERQPLTMNVADMTRAEVLDPLSIAPLSVDSSSVLSVLFRWNGRHYGFSDTFDTLLTPDASEIRSAIRSLVFTCP